jgi:hypothetical protein
MIELICYVRRNESMDRDLTELRVPGTLALLRQSKERARNAKWLIAEDWEQLLEEPLEEVREKLGVGPPPMYTRYFRVGGRLAPELVESAEMLAIGEFV